MAFAQNCVAIEVDFRHSTNLVSRILKLGDDLSSEKEALKNLQQVTPLSKEPPSSPIVNQSEQPEAMASQIGQAQLLLEN